MSELTTFAITVFMALFAIINPISTMPVFLSLVQDFDKKTRRAVNRKAVLTAFVIIVLFILLGRFIFEIFGITIPAFKITGGILIFFVGFEMLQSKKSNVKHLKEPKIDENIAISPLAIPILAGPGTIVTAMNAVSETSVAHTVITIIMVFLIFLMTYITFSLSEFVMKKLGNNVISVIGKIMGLVIAIIGTNMVIQGVKMAFNL